MDRSIWVGVIDQYCKALMANTRMVGGEIRQNIELFRKRDVVLVGAAAIATFASFVFLIVQTINAIAGSG